MTLLRTNDARVFARFSLSAFPLTALSFVTIGRLHLSWWWVLPAAIVDFLVRWLVVQEWSVECATRGEATIVRRTLRKDHVVATFPLRSWMSVEMREKAVFVGRGDIAWLMINAATEAERKQAASSIELLVGQAPATELPSSNKPAWVDVHNMREFLVRGCAWLLIAWVARPWQNLIFLVSLGTALQFLISAALYFHRSGQTN